MCLLHFNENINKIMTFHTSEGGKHITRLHEYSLDSW